MKRKKKGTDYERRNAGQLRELSREAFGELEAMGAKNAARAIAVVGKMVPDMSDALPGWHGKALTRSFFERKGKQVQ